MDWKRLKTEGHFPTLLAAFLYFDFSFMVWTLLGPLGVQIAQTLHLTPAQKGIMVSVPILSGALLRLVLGMLVDRIGAKRTGLLSQVVVMAGLAFAWLTQMGSFELTLIVGVFLGFAGASFAVALPQAGRWYPPNMQGLVLGLAGAGNIGVVIDSLLAPRLAEKFGWVNVFGIVLIPAVIVFLVYSLVAKDAPVQVKPKKFSDYWELFKEKDTHWFCFFYTVSFGGFVGLASSMVIYFNSEYALGAVGSGNMAAICTAVGALARPVGGAIADRIGGIRALHVFYLSAAVALVGAGFSNSLMGTMAAMILACGSFGMANGSVFQLLPQRFGREIGLMTGLVGAGGGIGGFLLGSGLGISKGWSGSYATGLFAFAGMCLIAFVGLGLVKKRWRTTWGAVAQARI